MNRHALAVLQFPEALDLVARYATSTLGADAVRALDPADALAAVVDELRRVEQTAAFLLRADDFIMPRIPDLRAALVRLGVEGSVWDGPTLRATGELVSGARAVRRGISAFAADYPLLAAIADRLVRLDTVEKRIDGAIDEAGEVRDGATRELGSIRREIRGARSRIVQKLERFMATLPSRYQVADASVTVRDGRYVIPVRREGRAEVGGLVHDESATGATLFVEPPMALELMNRLRELELAEVREVQRVLRELTNLVRPHHAELSGTLEAMVALDSLQARARYALAHNGRRPEMLSRGTRGYAVVAGFHPLLLAGSDPVVPFDLTMEEEERTLLVSGPNTGGKTVLLKAVGLLSAMAQAGVIPPVGPGTRLPVFGDIFADIGDEQSIEASLSTFSAHLKNLREILEHAGADALVLIDEIGSGTDPVEGGALARSILIELSRRGTLTIATTHLGELKGLASEEAGIVNASLQFDAAGLRPTYQLRKGVPGRSYGIAIARRLGFPEDVLARAEAHVPEGERDLGALLEDIEAKERAASEALARAQHMRNEAERTLRGVEEREADVARREHDAERTARQRARELLLDAREEVEAAIREVRATATQSAAAADDAARSARQRVEEQVRVLAEHVAAPDDPRQHTGAPLDVGQRVRIAATGAEGTVIELRDDRALVETRGVRLHVAAAELTPVGAQAPVRRSPAVTPAQRGGWSGPDFDPASEIDLRGLRADEVAGRLQPAIDAAVQAALPGLRIIHGKGTGALRQVVAELLQQDRRVAQYRPGGVGEGGTGVTVVELR